MGGINIRGNVQTQFDAQRLVLRSEGSESAEVQGFPAAMHVDTSFGLPHDPVTLEIVDVQGGRHQVRFADQAAFRRFMNDDEAELSSLVEGQALSPHTTALLAEVRTSADVRGGRFAFDGRVFTREDATPAPAGGVEAPRATFIDGVRGARVHGQVGALQEALVEHGDLPPTHGGRSNIDGREGERTRAARTAFFQRDLESGDHSRYARFYRSLEGRTGNLPTPEEVARDPSRLNDTTIDWPNGEVAQFVRRQSQARLAYDEGQAAFSGGDYAVAAERFAEARRIDAHPATIQAELLSHLAAAHGARERTAQRHRQTAAELERQLEGLQPPLPEALLADYRGAIATMRERGPLPAGPSEEGVTRQ